MFNSTRCNVEKIGRNEESYSELTSSTERPVISEILSTDISVDFNFLAISHVFFGKTLVNLRIDFSGKFSEYARYHDYMIPSIVMHFLISLKFFFTEFRYFGTLRSTV